MALAHLPPDEAPPPRLEVVRDLAIPTDITYNTAYTGSLSINYTVERPREVLDETPVLFVYGFAGIEPAYEGLRHYLASNGRIAVTIRPPRGTLKTFISPWHWREPILIHAQALHGVKQALHREHGFKTVSLAAHSMGNYIISYLQEEDLDDTPQITMVNSIGITPETTLGLAQKLPLLGIEVAKSWSEMPFVGRADAQKQMAWYFANPLRIMAEGIVVSNCNIHEGVAYMQELGIDVAAQWSPADPLLNAQKAHEIAKGLVGLSVISPNPTSGHLAAITRPHEAGSIIIRPAS